MALLKALRDLEGSFLSSLHDARFQQQALTKADSLEAELKKTLSSGQVDLEGEQQLAEVLNAVEIASRMMANAEQFGEQVVDEHAADLSLFFSTLALSPSSSSCAPPPSSRPPTPPSPSPSQPAAIAVVAPSSSSSRRGGGGGQDASNDPTYEPWRLWILTHFSHPYPTEQDRLHLLATGPAGKTAAQLQTWFTNSRRRSGWQELYRLHGQGSEHGMKELLERVESGEATEMEREAVEKVKTFFQAGGRDKVDDQWIEEVRRAALQPTPQATAIKEEEPIEPSAAAAPSKNRKSRKNKKGSVPSSSSHQGRKEMAALGHGWPSAPLPLPVTPPQLASQQFAQHGQQGQQHRTASTDSSFSLGTTTSTSSGGSFSSFGSISTAASSLAPSPTDDGEQEQKYHLPVVLATTGSYHQHQQQVDPLVSQAQASTTESERIYLPPAGPPPHLLPRSSSPVKAAPLPSQQPYHFPSSFHPPTLPPRLQQAPNPFFALPQEVLFTQSTVMGVPIPRGMDPVVAAQAAGGGWGVGGGGRGWEWMGAQQGQGVRG